MLSCINKNSVEYQSLKSKAGIPEFILESISRDFMTKYGRLPYLDELPDSNSEPYLKELLKINQYGGTKVESILEMTGKETIEEAVIDINNLYRDLETSILPILDEALVDIVHRPTDNNFSNWTEEDLILAEAPRDNNGNLLAPNGRISHLTEKLYALVRTKAFKNWFGDWETIANLKAIENDYSIKENNEIPPHEDSKGYDILYKGNKIGIVALAENNGDLTIRGIGIDKNLRGKGIGKNLYKWLMYTAYKNNGTLYSDNIYDSWISQDALRVWASLEKEGIAVPDDYTGGYHTNLPETSKVVDENGEPLVVYHGTATDFNSFSLTQGGKNTGLTTYTDLKTGEKILADSASTFFFSDRKGVAESYGFMGAYYSLLEIAKRINNLITLILEKPLTRSFLGKNYDLLLQRMDEYSEFNPRFSKVREYLEKVGERGFNQKEIEALRKLLIETRRSFQNLFTAHSLSDWSDLLYEFKAFILEYNNDDGIDRLLSGEIPKTLLKEYRYKNNGSDSSLMLSDGHFDSSFNNISYSEENGLTINNKKVTKMSRDLLKSILNSLEGAVVNMEISQKEDLVRQIYERRSFNKAFFLNVKNPLIHDYEGTRQGYGYKGSDKYSFGYISARLVKKAHKDGNDGVIYENVLDPYLANNYGVFKSNQIKSAESNSGSFNRLSGNIYDIEPNGYFVLNNALLKLALLHGITFNETSDAELNSEKWQNIIPDASLVNAFIYNGQIYINLDRANLDAPIHEMFHIFVGSLRFTNPLLYQLLVDSVLSFPNYLRLLLEYPNRTRNDVNEEILVTEVAKYLVGESSSLSSMDSATRYEISYNIKRMLDTVLMGEDSVKTISEDRLFNLSLKELAQEVNSAVMTNNPTTNLKGAELHRKLNNIKADLFKNGQLEEYCD